MPLRNWYNYGTKHDSTPKNTVKKNSERRIPRKSSENQRLFTGANLVLRPASFSWGFLLKKSMKE